VALRLAASGIEHIAVMDFDTVEIINLDRLIGATRLDALLHRAKVDVAHRLLSRASTARQPEIRAIDLSVCEPAGHDLALDYDVIFSCVDRHWPRAVLNMLAYADLIPVIDGGLHIDAFADGGMRNATWRSHVIRPGRPCLVCNHQLDLGHVAPDREGLLDDPEYIQGAGLAAAPARQNVATLSVRMTRRPWNFVAAS
ncbi:MAG: ThiF family adenylyltransferase, partial [Acidimicrobiales bacterium]